MFRRFYWLNISMIGHTFCLFLLKLKKLSQDSITFQKQPPEVFYKKDVLMDFANSTEKCLHQVFRPSSLQLYLKTDFSTGIFPWNFRKSKEHLFWRTDVNDSSDLFSSSAESPNTNWSKQTDLSSFHRQSNRSHMFYKVLLKISV